MDGLNPNQPSIFRILFQNLTLGSLAKYAFRFKKTPITIKGLEILDRYKDRVVILAPNHQSYLDAPAIVQAAGVDRMRRFYALGWVGLFQNAVFGFILDKLNVTPISYLAPLSIRTILKRVKAGTSFVVFPEGQRAANDQLMEFKGGFAWLAKKAGPELNVVVLPIYIQGSTKAFPRGGRWTGNHPVYIEIGNPLHTNDFKDRHEMMEAYRIEMHQMDTQFKSLVALPVKALTLRSEEAFTSEFVDNV
jgi:1-acyl-sn-glycerol-3-phosphate acyltransferase